MKKALILASMLMLLAGAANAAAYVGLYNDLNHSVCSVTSSVYGSFDCYVFMVDADRGVRACEYKVAQPAGYLGIGTINNPDVNLTMGSWDVGITVSFATCHYEWVWAQKITFLCTVAPIPATINISGRPDSEPYFLQSASCELGNPIYPLEILTVLYLNQPCGPVAVEESSWGAIKSLF